MRFAEFTNLKNGGADVIYVNPDKVYCFAYSKEYGGTMILLSMAPKDDVVVVKEDVLTVKNRLEG